MQSITIEKMAGAIAAELENYDQQVTEGLKKEVEEAAAECQKEIAANSPKRTGGYAKGWSRKKAFESKNDLRIVVYNKKHYRRTHLLENGHAKVNGGRVRAYPHIAPAAQRAEENLVKKAKVIVSGG